MAFIKTQRLRTSRDGSNYIDPPIHAMSGEKEIWPRGLDAETQIIGRQQLGQPSWIEGAQFPIGAHVYSREHVLQTKYVVDATAHSLIGSIVTMTSGEKVHVDLTVEHIATEGNRR